MMLPSGHIVRQLESLIADRLREEPAVLLEGPRSVGKSTLLRQISARSGSNVIDLDDPATRSAVEADPRLFVAAPRPVLFDEYQQAPAILDAIKSELNKSSHPGQFVITGSTRHDALPIAAQALTGRLHRMLVPPLTQSEIEVSGANLLTALFATPNELRSSTPGTTPREDSIGRIVRGGFPLALARPNTSSRNRWFDDYLRLTLERDALAVHGLRRAERLPPLLERLASQTGQVLNVSKAGSAVGLDATTATSYLKVLEALFLVQRLPAWGKTLTARSSASPKIHVVDSGIAARLLRLSEAKLASRDATAITELGHLLASFVVNELLRQASWLDEATTTGHWRTHDGDEVDLVIERDDGLIVAVEVKAGSRVTTRSIRPLERLRDALGERFRAGVILYLGDNAYRATDRLYVVPVDRLWRQQHRLN